MSEPCTKKTLISSSLVLLFLISVLSPLAAANPEETQEVEQINVNADARVVADIADFQVNEGYSYLFMDEETPVVSATSFMKKSWIDAGRPYLEGHPSTLEESITSGRAAGRSCNSYITGDTLTAPTSGGSVDVYVAKTTTTVAFLVQTGRTLSSTVLQNLASTWDQTIYPTLTTYYGKDYQDGRGVAPPDVDGNCQVEIVIYDIDGAYNIGGYFAPGLASQREVVFVDYADITLSWGKSIIAHELQHLLHNAQDPYENLWVDEGNADVAIYLCFGADSTLRGHVNGWTSAPELSVRWWNQRNADYGAGFMMMMYLVDQLGGGPAMRQLVQDSSTGGVGVRNLAIAPPNGQGGKIGSNMNDVFANFSIAATLDSDQGIYGYANLDLRDTCSGAVFCKAQPAATNSNWATPYSSTGHQTEAWGIRSFKFTPGGASPAPLTMRLTTDVAGFDGVLVTKSMTDGLYSVSDLTFQGTTATALVPGFGNLTDEVWAITWYASSVADCDYTSCGNSYPQGTIDIEAARITSPASIDFNTTTLTDRDGDGLDDTVEVGFDVTSNAFFEDLDTEISVLDSSGNMVDSITTRITAGGGVAAPYSIFFTPNMNDQYSFNFKLKNVLGEQIDELTSAPQLLSNMRPVSNGTVSTNLSLTWEKITFSGDGFDAWGLSLTNNSLPYLDSPVAYAWDFGDNQTSSLKSPTRHYEEIGVYNATLRVKDTGGLWSETDIFEMVLFDDTIPNPIVTVNDQFVANEISVLTGQRILFSAARTTDNVPVTNLNFTWDWGDGSSVGGIGAYTAYHSWDSIDAQNVTYNLTLTVSDGINIAVKNILVQVNNRLPVQVFNDVLETTTYAPLQVPVIFDDIDGEIEAWSWSFPGGVNLDGIDVGRDSEFGLVSSTNEFPTPAWNTPGNKTITLTVTDDDGGSSVANLLVIVRNQLPVADFSVRESASAVGQFIDVRSEDLQVDTQYVFDGRASFDPDGSLGDFNDLIFTWGFPDGNDTDSVQPRFTFGEPGVYRVNLTVTDEQGEQSITRTMIIRVANPLPVANARIVEGWIDDSLITIDSDFNRSALPDVFKRVFDDDGNTHAAPGTLLYFDSSGTRDGDRKYEGKFVPLEQSSPDWNGIVQYSWDFGDGSPISNEPFPWHSYDRPGEYSVSLTVRDSYGTGDVTRVFLMVIIDYAPQINGLDIPSEIYEGIQYALDANVSDYESQNEIGLCLDDDVDDGSDIDCDQVLATEVSVRWELDLANDTNQNNIPDDDWKDPVSGQVAKVKMIWMTPGKRDIKIEVCDSLNQCVTMTETVSVLPEELAPPSLSDYTLEDWSAWFKRTGTDALLFLALVMVALILGYFVMRAPTDSELDAMEAEAVYDDLEVVEGAKGLVSIDDHTPPPTPKILTKDERTNSESGYVRPVRRG